MFAQSPADRPCFGAIDRAIVVRVEVIQQLLLHFRIDRGPISTFVARLRQGRQCHHARGARRQ
jgi:hypothetical protein